MEWMEMLKPYRIVARAGHLLHICTFAGSDDEEWFITYGTISGYNIKQAVLIVVGDRKIRGWLLAYGMMNTWAASRQWYSGTDSI